MTPANWMIVWACRMYFPLWNDILFGNYNRPYQQDWAMKSNTRSHLRLFKIGWRPLLYCHDVLFCRHIDVDELPVSHSIPLNVLHAVPKEKRIQIWDLTLEQHGFVFQHRIPQHGFVFQHCIPPHCIVFQLSMPQHVFQRCILLHPIFRIPHSAFRSIPYSRILYFSIFHIPVFCFILGILHYALGHHVGSALRWNNTVWAHSHSYTAQHRQP